VISHYRKSGVQSTVHLVTRLDRDTSGAMLIAKHLLQHDPVYDSEIPPADKPLLLRCRQKRMGKPMFVSRRYLAVVHGIMLQKEGTVDAPIGRKHDSIIERMASSALPTKENGKADVWR
jgi:23S rRNA pseudouridine1911/1915/1917 synthase